MAALILPAPAEPLQLLERSIHLPAQVHAIRNRACTFQQIAETLMGHGCSNLASRMADLLQMNLTNINQIGRNAPVAGTTGELQGSSPSMGKSAKGFSRGARWDVNP